MKTKLFFREVRRPHQVAVVTLQVQYGNSHQGVNIPQGLDHIDVCKALRDLAGFIEKDILQATNIIEGELVQ